jgi:hypothetical protein
LDGITLYVQFVSTSCLVQNVWMQSPFMFNLSVLHVCFKTVRWNHPVYSTCLFFRHEEQTIWTYRVIPSKSFKPDMKYWQLEHSFSCLVQNLDGITVYVQLLWLKTFRRNLPVCSIGLNHPVCLICQYFMYGSKLLYWIILYVQLAEHTGCFHP